MEVEEVSSWGSTDHIKGKDNKTKKEEKRLEGSRDQHNENQSL